MVQRQHGHLSDQAHPDLHEQLGVVLRTSLGDKGEDGLVCFLLCCGLVYVGLQQQRLDEKLMTPLHSLTRDRRMLVVNKQSFSAITQTHVYFIT